MRTTSVDAGDLLSVLRPLLVLAGIGFAAGFLGYWALATLSVSPTTTLEPAQPAVLIVPVASPDNPPKVI